MIRNISPIPAAYAARCTPDLLRDWRRQHFLRGIGAREGKGHLFSINEVVRIAVAVFFARAGFGVGDAFSFASERAAQIDNLTTIIASGAQNAGDDFILTIAINPDIGAGFQSVTAAPMGRVRLDRDLQGAFQVNLSNIIRSAIERLSFHERRVA